MDFPAGGLDGATLVLVEGFEGVIASFDVDAGLGGDERDGGANVGKNADGIDRLQSGKIRGSIVYGVDQTPLALQPTDGGVAVDANEQQVAEIPGGFEVSDVTEVENVEATVRRDERFSAAQFAPPLRE